MSLSTEANWNTFLSNLSHDPKKVAKVMYLYLVETGYEQKEAQIEVYGHFDYNYASIIMQCYNFSGRNARKYSGTKLGGIVTEEDVLAFVKAYPKGIVNSFNPGSGIEMEEFLRERISKRAAKSQAQRATKDSSATSKAVESNSENGFIEKAENAATVLTDELKSWFGKKDKPKAEGAKEKPEISEGTSSVIGIIGIIVILLVIALIFNWFGIRTALIGFLINAFIYIWIFGLLIFLLMLLFNKIKVMDGKRFLIKLVFFVAVGGISYIILVYVVDFLAKLR